MMENQLTSTNKYKIVPVISRDEAVRIFQSKKSWLSKSQKLKNLNRIDLPLYIFSITTMDQKGNKVDHEVTIDGIDGHFAHIKTDNLQKDEQVTEDSIPFSFDQSKAEYEARREFRAHIFRLRPGIQITGIQLITKAWYPFWIGYFEKKNGYTFDVIDGCSGKLQGVKMRSLFAKLIINKNKNDEKKASPRIDN